MADSDRGNRRRRRRRPRRPRHRYRERRPRQGSIWEQFKSSWLAVLVAVALIGGGLFYTYNLASSYTLENYGQEPWQLIWSGAPSIDDVWNATGQGLENLEIAATTPLYRVECQRQYIDSAIEDRDIKITNCVREKQGLPPLNGTEEQRREQRWQVRGATSFLSIDVRSEVVDTDPVMQDRCGQECGVIEATLTNNGRTGDSTFQLNDISMRIERRGENVPIYLNPQDVGTNVQPDGDAYQGSNKFYTLRYFIDGTSRLQDWMHAQEVQGDDWQLQPGESRTVTFLANLSAYRTYLRSDVIDAAQNQVETIERQLDGNETLEDYCQQTYGETGAYQGGPIPIPTESSDGVPAGNLESFPDLEGMLCKGDMEEIVEREAMPIFGDEQIQIDVNANYTATTDSVINLRITNYDYWDGLNIDERQNFMLQNCRPIGQGNIPKQHSFIEQRPTEAVAFMLYTECDIHYYPPDTEGQIDALNEPLIHFQAKADTAQIDRFRIQDVDGSNTICSSPVSGSTDAMPDNLYTDTAWFTQQNMRWNSPVATCRFQVPEIGEESQQDTLSFDLEATYEASVESSHSMAAGQRN